MANEISVERRRVASRCSRWTRRSGATRSPSRWRRSSWPPARSSTPTPRSAPWSCAARAASSAPAATARTLDGGRARPGRPRGLRGARRGLPLVRARRRAGGADGRRRARRRGGRRAQPDAGHRPPRSSPATRRSSPASSRSACTRAAATARCWAAPARARPPRRWPCSASGSTASAPRRSASPGSPWTTATSRQTALELATRAAADPELARRTAASLRTVLGPPAIPWPAALELERASQMWSMRRKALG